MFKSKLEVDRHVDNCLKKINNETERNLRSFSFAKLYFNVGDYEHARRYVSSYLNVKPKSAEGYLLLGKSLEKLGKKEAALEAYRNSLQMDSKQNNLVIKVCELLSSDDVEMDQSGARYFCDLALSFDPNNPAVYRLKERLITVDSDDPQKVSTFLLQELENRPTDINLRVRLLKHFLQHNLIKEAYKHASEIEEKNLLIFHDNLSWYETFAEVLVRFQRDLSFTSQLTWDFWFLSVSVLDRLAALSLDEHTDNLKSSNEYVAAVFNFDQMLSKASQNINGCQDRQLVSLFLSHYHAQLYFHLATLIFKQAKKDFLTFKEAGNICLPVLLAAYHIAPPDLQSMWFIHLPENRRKLVQYWHKEASYRCSQTGHILLAAAKDRKSLVLEKAVHYSTGIWRDQLFKRVFVNRDHHLKMPTSFFVSNLYPLEPVIKLPDPTEVLKYDEVAQLINPYSLHQNIWIALNNKLSNVEVKSFEGLQYSIKNLTNCGAETLNILDVQSFLYCATLCAQSRLEHSKHLIYYHSDKPKVLPVSITENLGTLSQSKFFTAAYKMYKNEPGANMGELRLLLIKGIEVVRCVGHHGLDVKLLVNLANIFEERLKHLTKQSEIEFTNARAELYWKTALPLLEKIKNNQVITYPTTRLFEYKTKEMSLSEAVACIEKGKLFTGTQLMKKKEYEKALNILEHLKDPYASFYQSQIYKHMADQKTNDSKENVTSEMRSQNIIMLSKARDCLYLTLDRLREPSVDRSHPLNSQLGSEIEKMERLLSRIDPDCTNRNECEVMSDENPSSENSISEQYLSTYTHHPSFHVTSSFTPKNDHNHSTPLKYNITRQEARPSPERLDAQIRQMVAFRDTALSSILEQNKIIADSHRSLLEELRSFKDAFNNLTAMTDDLRNMKSGFDKINQIEKSMDELRNSFDIQHLVDMVQELKKEVNELKKDQTKNNQLSDEDLYVLDPDYGVDYNINSNINTYGTNLPSVYPNYQAGRIPNANLPAYGHPGLYPGLYPGLAYAYGGLGLPQPGTLPFVSDPQVPSIASSVPSSYPPAVLPQATLSQVLPNPNTTLGANFLTGQALSQIKSQSPKTITSGMTMTTQSNFSSAVSSNFASSSKAPPVNVVITSSDPLPTNKIPTSQPILSVTIPPQHIRNSGIPRTVPHNYQIPLPSSSINPIITAPSILSKPPPAISTQSLLSNIAPPIFSAVNQNKNISKNVSLGLQIEKTLDQTFNSDKSLNKSNVSSASIDEHDPCPDFKPIIPLPDEVPVNTGEEGEQELYCQHAKLFRYVDTNGVKEWKERGVGSLKILKNPNTKKIRILMRRDQIHKICANHFISDDMSLTPMSNNDRAYIWAAHDFADEKVVIEKFCVRFKTAEDARKFYNAFEAAKKMLDEFSPVTSLEPVVKPVIPTTISLTTTPKTNQPPTLGGFVFTSTPTFKPKDIVASATVPETDATPKTSPFSSFSFGKPQGSNLFRSIIPTTEAPTFSPLVISQQKLNPSQNEDADGSHAEEFVPTAEFKPVVALPDLIEVVTGEENSEVLFEARAKLFRYDTNGEKKEWKERGVGVVKVLKDDSIRIVMRRDQVHKVCCNHTILKNMTFKLNSTNPRAVVWHAKDFSEGVLTPETFTIKFKTEDLANQFLQSIQSAQTSMDENNKIVNNKHHKPESRSRTTSFGEKFKPAKGSWECKNCYIINEGKVSFCIACETSKSGTIPKTTEESGPGFSFGNFPNQPEENVTSSIVIGQKTISNTWGSAFKPTEGTWECDCCLVRNSAEREQCVSCDTPKGTALKSNVPLSKSIKSINLDTPGQKFNFGMPVGKPEEKAATPVGFGDAFKPKAGTWECKVCLIRNQPETVYCVSCETPKDDTIPKKETTKGINLETPGQKFMFGIPQTPQNIPTDATKTETLKPPTSNTFSFKPATIGEPAKEPATTKQQRFVFGSPQKHDFEFKPRSPRRISSGQGDEESDGSYVEEEEDNIYFKPVIPLPEKVEVKTGEEEEDALYCHRAKLFRFVGGEWKERGLGDIKILRRKDSGKLRVVMRREQVLKICLNHILTDAIDYISKDDKSWLFHAADFSEGEITHEQFCVRFKNSEIAQDFRKAVNNALEGTPKDCEGNKQVSLSKEENDDDDIQIVFESKVTPEEEQEALRLGLPPKFFAYRQLPDCNCEQCKKDDEYLKELFFPSTSSTETSSKPLTYGTPNTSLTPVSGDSVFGTPKGTIFNFSNQEKSDSLRELLLKPPMLSSTIKPATKEENKKTEEIGTSKPFTFSFGQGDTPKTNIFSQPTPGNIFSTTTGGVFSTSSTSTNLFSNSSSASSTLFGKNTSSGSIFGTAGSNTSIFRTSSTTPIFGSTANSNTNIFNDGLKTSNIGDNSAVPTTAAVAVTLFNTNTPIFGTSKNTPSSTTPLFGATTTSTSLFGTTVTSTPLFGSIATNTSLFSTPQTTSSSSTNIFGTPITSTSLFGQSNNIFGKSNTTASSQSGSIFGNQQQAGLANLSFGSIAKTVESTPKTTNLKEDDELVLKCNSDISFASLAQSTSADAQPAFNKLGDESFSFLGAGTPVFGSKKDKKKTGKSKADKDKSKNESDEGDAEHADEEYDPHYEPIVPLPEAIVVSTGEEHETALFNERAKLYRFDNETKEWKERGVGQLKILHHPENNTHRLLLRREQVHKIVLNQLIVSTMELQPMTSSDKAWMWAGYNYTDEENRFEKLAVRFKNVELSKRFYDILHDCIVKITEAQNRSLPATVENYGLEDVSGDELNTADDDEYEDDEDLDDEEDDRSVMFMKRCTLSELKNNIGWEIVKQGDLQVYYDSELYAARIAVNDDAGDVLSNTLIGINTIMEIDKNECIWKAVEWADCIMKWRTLKATFSSEMEAQEFHSSYLEGINYAHEVGIIDELTNEHEHDAENED